MPNIKEQCRNLEQARVFYRPSDDLVLLFDRIPDMPEEVARELLENIEMQVFCSAEKGDIFVPEEDPDHFLEFFSKIMRLLSEKMHLSVKGSPAVFMLNGPYKKEQKEEQIETIMFNICPGKENIYHCLAGTGNELNEACVRLRWGKWNEVGLHISGMLQIVPGKILPKETFDKAVDSARAFLEAAEQIQKYREEKPKSKDSKEALL